MAEPRTLDQTLPVHGQGLVGTPWWGMLCLIATEGILFAYLIFSYAYLAHAGPGGALATHWRAASLTIAIPATIALLASSGPPNGASGPPAPATSIARGWPMG